MTTMKAVAYTAYGGPEVTKLLDMPKPTPGRGQVLIRTAAAGFNPLDIYQRSGAIKMVFPQTLPVIGGNELSGTVAALGDGATKFAVGDNVVVRVGKVKMEAYAEYSAHDEDIVARAPKSIPLVDAGGLPLAGLTAHQAFDVLGLKAGDRVLITGGAGGVGQFAIQLAKIRGAIVTTTASPDGEPLVRKAGADTVINYRTTKLASLTESEKFDKVFDLVGFKDGDAAMEDLFAAVARGGHIVSIAGVQLPGQFDEYLPWWKRWIVNRVLGSRSGNTVTASHRAGIHYEYLFMHPDGPQLQQLSDYVDAGKLRVVVDSRFPVDQYRQGFERLESGRAKGKILLEFGAASETVAAGAVPATPSTIATAEQAASVTS